ncbi:hypothetical protein OUZ56_018232 [Daphnia magna]|uniref:Mitochondrial mRNA-processing protein COX24 C-terminal domain-containing protein n=1 Tax=Daphnia magna TaxID=35525 RepID=A0ABQ9Z8C1_9CRUS|nr:hypothetical protein OUZ56_018232 [Daphnia magna]
MKPRMSTKWRDAVDASLCRACSQSGDASGYGIGAVLAQIQPPPQSADLANSDVQELTRKKRFKILRRKGKKMRLGGKKRRGIKME